MEKDGRYAGCHGYEPVDFRSVGYRPRELILTSKGFPQLYISSFTDLTPQQAKSTEEAVKEVIRRLRSYQTVDGAFAYWPGGTSSNGY